ncbi:TonB-dependent siderophore receptor [Motilimonas pumila]|uniref:TonB-dependent receptor n=1 Tax=Motilimonas pumila TaxID=2303987 RepID=A0A418YEZ1_9GAMM|nr:TonB-dependent receptor [Motilimonas pumila]RJG47754.1 TonB-dependent receptor [Motilimonas pumila]
MNMKLTIIASAIVSAIIAPSVFAESETGQVSDKVVVTGEKFTAYTADTNTSMKIEVDQLDTPGQVTVINSELIDDQRASSLSEVLANDASISVGNTTSRNRERFSLRGFELGSSSGFLRDGRVHWSHYRQPIELLESVEILKGPSGLLYGKSSPAGIVNMVSKKPTHETQINFSQDLGSNNHTRTIFDISGSLNEAETVRGRFITSKENKDNWRDYLDGQTGETDRFIGAMMLDFDLTESVTLGLHYDRTEDTGNVDTGSPVDDNGKPINPKHSYDASWSEIENVSENMGFDVNAALNSEWKLATGYNHQKFKRHDVESGMPTRNDDGSLTYGGFDRKDHWKFDTAYFDVTGDLELAGMRHQILVGADALRYSYERDQYSMNKVTVNPGETPVPSVNPDRRRTSNSNYESYGFYVQDLVSFNSQWQGLAGVRVDHYVNDDNESQTNFLPKVAVMYHPMSNGTIYATYSESFEPLGTVTSSPDEIDLNDGKQLDPVKGRLYELGTKWNLLDEKLFVSSAVFQITEDNTVIVEDRDPGLCSTPSCVETTQNGSRTHTGVELAVSGSATDDLHLFSTFMYLDAEFDKHQNPDLEGKRPADVPEFSASIWGKYDITNNTGFNLGAYYVGSRYGDDMNTFKKDAYTRVDAGLSHHYQYDQDLAFVIRAKVENVFNEDYLLGGDQRAVVVGEERNYLLSLEMKY